MASKSGNPASFACSETYLTRSSTDEPLLMCAADGGNGKSTEVMLDDLYDSLGECRSDNEAGLRKFDGDSSRLVPMLVEVMVRQS